ncbi:hypothetical protein SKAU_G00390100 [Synaphobranchus kaupii]|uniref:Uncharacterized protein n=1 Tax=Synaphobranchus kaupii TaxID=118154 RepID=A0A9Q1IBI3_SYNKA|nr:hypothetical protein SKAU_G00390100 [Synaphobranchus kaupii]
MRATLNSWKPLRINHFDCEKDPFEVKRIRASPSEPGRFPSARPVCKRACARIRSAGAGELCLAAAGLRPGLEGESPSGAPPRLNTTRPGASGGVPQERGAGGERAHLVRP